MRCNWSTLRLAFACLTVGVGVLAAPKPAEATHFRYGHLTWRKSGNTTAQFTLTCSFKRSNYLGTDPDGFPAIGDIFSEDVGGTVLEFGDGSIAGGSNGGPLQFITVAVDPVRDLVVARALDATTFRDRINHGYADANNNGLPWTARINSCCRISTLQNNPDGFYNVETTVDMARNTFSAVSSLPPIIPVPEAGTSFLIPGADNDRDHTLRYRLATDAEGVGPFGGVFDQPPGCTIDPATGVYSVGPGLAVGLWCTQVIIEEYNGTGLLVGKVALDFILEVRTNITGNPPVFTAPTPPNGTSLVIKPGTPVNFGIRATDPNGDDVELNMTGLPLGASQSANLPVTAKSPNTDVFWVPTSDDVGAYSITFTAEDPNGGFVFTSILICVIPPLQIIEPNGGEAYLPGDQARVTWQAIGCPRPGGVRIELSRDGGVNFDQLLAPVAPDSGNFNYTITPPGSRLARVRITSVDDPSDFDVSDEDFSITEGVVKQQCTTRTRRDIPDDDPTYFRIPLTFASDLIIRGTFAFVDITHPYIGDLEVALVHPDSAAKVAAGQAPNPEDIALLHDETGEDRDNLVTTFGAGTGFTRPAERLTKFNGRAAKGVWNLLVRDLNPGDVGWVNQWCLTIIGPQRGVIKVLSPNGGERWDVGGPQKVRWTATNVQGNVAVQLSRDNGVTFTNLGIVPSTVGEFTTTATAPETDQALIRVVSVEEAIQVDTSDAVFSILNPTLRILQPNGGDKVSTGKPYTIKWLSVPAVGTVRIQLSLDGGVNFQTITNSAPDTGQFIWTPDPSLDTARARIRITANTGPPRSDISDADFTIQTPEIEVVSPNGGEIWYTGTKQTITWTSVGVEGPVKLELFRNNVWESLAGSTANDGTEEITVTDPPFNAAKVRVTSVNEAQITDTSNGSFVIRKMVLTVTAPNGGEVWGVGTKRQITWTSDGVPGKVNIRLSTNGGVSFTNLFPNTDNDGAQEWPVSGPATTKAIIRIDAVGANAFDVSDRQFSIVDPGLRVTRPNGGEELRVGSQSELTWTSAGLGGNVKIELSRDNGGAWETLFSTTPNDGREVLTVTGPDTADALLRVTSVEIPTSTDRSDQTFRIVTPGLTVTRPNGGEQVQVGSVLAIEWDSQGLSGNVKIELTRNGGRTFETIVASAPNNGRANWTVTGPGSGNSRVRISSLTNTAVSDQSNGPFTILSPTIEVLSPNGGEVWLLGTRQTITWRAEGLSGNVHIDLSRDNGQSFQRLFSNRPNDGSDAWDVSGTPTRNAIIKVLSADNASSFDISNRTFVIDRPTLTVVAPQAGDKWRAGTRKTIRWEGTVINAGGTVDIQLSRNGGAFATIITDAPNTGSANWKVQGKAAKKAVIRVIWKPNTTIRDDSGEFIIQRARR